VDVTHSFRHLPFVLFIPARRRRRRPDGKGIATGAGHPHAQRPGRLSRTLGPAHFGRFRLRR